MNNESALRKGYYAATQKQGAMMNFLSPKKS